MGDATGEDITRACACVLVVFTLMTVYAWVGVYRLWTRHFYRKPLSDIPQKLRLLGWLLLVALTSFCTILFFLVLYLGLTLILNNFD